jgi:hypothetical protein
MVRVSHRQKNLYKALADALWAPVIQWLDIQAVVVALGTQSQVIILAAAKKTN